ncbi:MAG: hypothetical protein RIR97_325 [Pseudomonadota bacterium]|jgi:DNA-binding MarR family transcriptional regulator
MNDEFTEQNFSVPSNFDLSVLTTAIGYQLRRAQMAVFQDFSETFTAEGLRPADFSVMILIWKNPGSKQSEVAEALGIQRANFVAIIDSLERRGLAERRKTGSDRRVQSLYLTDIGEGFAANMMRSWRSHEDRMIEKLGGPEKHVDLINILSRFYS